jgi:hypothetical protein
MTLPPGAILISALGAVLAATPSAHPQDPGPGLFSDIVFDMAGEADLLVSAPAPDTGASAPYGDIHLRASAERIAQGGTRYGVRLGGRIQRDSGRRGIAQQVGDCSAIADGCASGAGLPAVGTMTGLHAAPGISSAGPRAGVETAEVYALHGWGELRAGLGEGAARLEADPLPGAFRLARADAGLADPTGLAFGSTANTLSGHALKLTARSRRIAGFRASLSYTPDADACGVEACRLRPDPEAFASAGARHVIEAGLSFNHRFRASGQRWIASVTGTRGDASGPFAASFEDPWAVSARAAWQNGAVTLGAGALASNDGLAGGRYEALAVSASYEFGDWLAAGELSRARSGHFGARGTVAQAGLSRLLANGALIGAGIQHAERRQRAGTGLPRDSQTLEGTHVFVEAGLRF